MTAIPGEPDDVAVAETVARCGALVARILSDPDGDPADLDAAIADLYRLPPELPVRGPLAAGLVMALMRTAADGPTPRMKNLNALLEIADRNPPPAPEWSQLRSAARTLVLMQDMADNGPFIPRATLAELDSLAASAGDNPGLQMMHRMTRMMTTFSNAINDSDSAALRQFENDVIKLRQEIGPDSPAVPLADALAAMSQVMAANERGDYETAWQALDQVQEQFAGQSEVVSPYLRRALDEAATMAAPLRPIMTGAGWSGGPADMPTDEQLAALGALAQRPDATDAERAFYRTAAGAATLGGGLETDPARIDAAIVQFREAVAGSAPDDPQRAFHLVSLGLGLMRRCEVTGSMSDLDEAADVLVAARELAGGPSHPWWSLTSEGLAWVRRRRGETPDARQVALEGLRSYAWRVLLQSDMAAATDVARSAAADAADLAWWCLRDNAPGDAVRALDAGRGLILFAATELRDITTRLDDAGRRDLAHRWRVATASGGPDSAPTELRREVLTVLSENSGPGTVASAGLLDPPSLPEIRSALAALDADALVYLVPGKFPTPGAAVIVPVDGPPSFIALANLFPDKELDVERYLAALSSRDATLADPHRDWEVDTADSEFLGSLDTLCDWAWRAAVGPLLERYLAGRPAPAGRPLRVVLVPMGELARIPWQAARRGDGVYAIELAAFSYAASARMLCDSAARMAVPLSPVGLVVGDPDTAGKAPELPAARAEAYAIHQTFYRGARYVGRRPDGSAGRSGRGSPGDVRGWLTARQPGAGAMLHLACHGVIRSDPADTTSYLLLADGELLTAEELVGTMAGQPDREIALVVLAACRTGVSGRGYDEAYSLGTAFLAGGVRSVLSTQWSIPDRATSVLTFMFHHYLMVERRPAWDALRRAQLWMLDADRRPPDTMPPPLRRLLLRTDPAQVVAWAGFVHWGQ